MHLGRLYRPTVRNFAHVVEILGSASFDLKTFRSLCEHKTKRFLTSSLFFFFLPTRCTRMWPRIIKKNVDPCVKARQKKGFWPLCEGKTKRFLTSSLFLPTRCTRMWPRIIKKMSTLLWRQDKKVFDIKSFFFFLAHKMYKDVTQNYLPVRESTY